MIQGFSCVIGGYSAALVGNIAIAKAMDVELATYLLALLYTLWRIPQRPGIRELERRSRGKFKEPLKKSKLCNHEQIK